MFVELALLFLLVLLYLVYTDRKPANMPPGPMEIPFIGRAPILDETAVVPMRKKYGDIFTTRVGSMRTVFIFDYRTSKEALAKMELAGRPAFIAEILSIDPQKNGGLAFTNGEHWQHNRRFVIRNLRNLGMGKSYLEGAINIEAQALVEDLRMFNGEPIPFPNSFVTASLNIIWQLLASKRYGLRSTEVDAMDRIKEDLLKNNLAVMLLPFFFPILKFIPKFIRNVLFKESARENFVKQIRTNVEAIVTEHEKKFDIDNPRDLIDEYLKDMQEGDEEKKPFLSKGSLLQIISELFDIGSDTIASELKWVIYLMAAYPDVTRKVQQQIDEHVPRDRLVSFGDKPCLPYLEAFIAEVLRFSSLVPLNMYRVALADVTLQGYYIPKGTNVISVNYSIHNDPKHWTEPEKFSPERFIDEDGKYREPKEGLFVFGSGRRVCPGESLAKMELFLFSAAVIQNFDVKLPEGTQLKHSTASVHAVRLPQDNTFVYSSRS